MQPTTEPIHVLHVDDDPGFLDLTELMLEGDDERLDVETATNAAAGLEYLADHDVDCVVSDYDMPRRNGIEFLEDVREQCPDVPFVLFTGKGSEEVASEAISAGVTDYLQKETGTDQFTVLANRVCNAVEKHRAERLADRAFQALDSAREGIALLGADGEFVYVNDAYCDVVGYDADALLGDRWLRLYPEGHVDRVAGEIIEAVEEVGHWSGEVVHERADGGRVVVNLVLTAAGEGSLICLARDVGDADSRRALREERQRFDLLIDAVTDYAIFMLDPDGYVTSWNPGAERLKGYTEDEVLGTHFSNFYTDEQRAAGLPGRLLQRALEEGSVEHRGPRVRKDGSTFPAKVVITAVFDEDGTHRGFGKVTEDASDRGD